MASSRLWVSIRQKGYSKMRSAIDILKPFGVKPAWIRKCLKASSIGVRKGSSYLVVNAVQNTKSKNNLKVIRALKSLNCPLTLEQQWILERNQKCKNS